jgi:hypothetical protein
MGGGAMLVSGAGPPGPPAAGGVGNAIAAAGNALGAPEWLGRFSRVCEALPSVLVDGIFMAGSFFMADSSENGCIAGDI